VTPLAKLITEQNFRRAKQREDGDLCGLYRRLDDVHCFDVTDAIDVLEDLARRIYDGAVSTGELSFLPAPKTWIEWRSPVEDCLVERKGYLLCASSIDETRVRCFEAQGQSSAGYNAWDADFVLRLHCSDNLAGSTWGMSDAGQDAIDGQSDFTERNILRELVDYQAARVHAALALINSPRVIGRRQHMPNAGLERRMLEKRAIVGRFPLHAWTEIVLPISPPDDRIRDAPVEAHLTGRRCLHFVRRHFRIINGVGVLVREHWRGDAALGIKRSRYRLAA
jgi:hypothetical protein